MEQNEPQEILTSNNIEKDVNAAQSNQDGFPNLKECESAQNLSQTDNLQPDTTPSEQIVASEPTVEQLQSALMAERDRVLRVSAEFDNYKKRSSREIADFRKFANEALLKQLLTVMDNLERALNSASSQPSGNFDLHSSETKLKCKKEIESQESAVIQGVEMTCKDIVKIFESFNVKPVDALGKPFDPIFHQAVSHQESAEHSENTVIAELQKGYLLHERLLRPSMVVVAKAKAKQE